MSTAHNNSIFKVLFLGVVFIFSGMMAHISFAAATTTDLFPVSAVDNTPTSRSRDPIVYSLASSTTAQINQLQHMAIQDCPTNPNTYFILNKNRWPQHVSTYDESQYIEFSFSTSTIPSDAVIDNVLITNSYFFDSNAVSGSDFSKLEFFLGPDADAINQELTMNPGLGQCSAPANDTIDITSLFTSVDQLNNFRVRFLAYETTSNGLFTDSDFLKLTVLYHAASIIDPIIPIDPIDPIDPVVPPTATTQDVAAHSVDNPFTVTLAGTDANNSPLSYSIVNNQTKGTLGTIFGHQVQFTPNGTLGDDSFTFKVNNGTTDSSPATVTLHLLPGATANLSLSTLDSQLSAGSSTVMTVSAKDSFGNNSVSDNSTIVNISSDIGLVTDTALTLSGGQATTTITSTTTGVAIYTVSSGSLVSATTSITFSDSAVVVPDTPPVVTVVPVHIGGHGYPVSSNVATVAVVEPSSGGNNTIAPSVPRGVVTDSNPTPVVSDTVSPSEPATPEPQVASGDNQNVQAPESVVPNEVAVTPPQDTNTDGSALGASALGSGASDTATNELVVSLSLILIGGIYVSVWKPFRKKI